MIETYSQGANAALELAAARLAPLYQHYRWTWHTTQTIPTEEDLVRHLRTFIEGTVAPGVTGTIGEEFWVLIDRIAVLIEGPYDGQDERTVRLFLQLAGFEDLSPVTPRGVAP